jgi:hypothetical protein
VQCLAAGTLTATRGLETRWLVWTAAAILGVLLSFAVFYTAGYVLQQLPPAWLSGTETE